MSLAISALCREQLAPTARCVVVPGGLGVLRDVDALEPDLCIAHRRETVNQRRSAGAQRLDLGATQDHASLKSVLNEVVVIGLAVSRNDLQTLLLGHGRHPFRQVMYAPHARSSRRRLSV